MKNIDIDTVIIDIDNTFAEDISWQKITLGLRASADTFNDIIDRNKRGFLPEHEVKRQILQLWRNTGNANWNYMEIMFKFWKLKTDSIEMSHYLTLSYRVCIISGSLDMYAKTVAEKLQIDDWYANTQLVWDKDGKLTDYVFFPDKAAKKLEQFRDYAGKNNIDKTRCAVIGSKESDITLFKEIKFPILVTSEPLPELEALAFKKVSNLSEIKEIL